MKYSIPLKFIAVALCVLSLTVCAVSGLGIKLMDDSGLYYTDQEEAVRNYENSIAVELAWFHAERYAADTIGHCPEEVLQNQFDFGSRWVSQFGNDYALDILMEGELVKRVNPEIPREGIPLTYTVSSVYPTVVDSVRVENNLPPETTEQIILQENSSWSTRNDQTMLSAAESGRVLYTNQIQIYSYDENGEEISTLYTLGYYQTPQMDVSVYMSPDSIHTFQMFVIRSLYSWRYVFLAALVVCLLTFAAGVTYICISAGKTSADSPAVAAGLNRIPLDIYTGAAAGLTVLLQRPVSWFMNTIGFYEPLRGQQGMLFLISVLCVSAISLVLTGCIYAFASQFKLEKHAWWKHTAIGFCLIRIGRGIRTAIRGIRALFLMLPVIWQWLTAAFLMAVSVAIPTAGLVLSHSGFWRFFWLMLLVTAVLVCIGIVCYSGYCFGLLMKSCTIMANGDLDHQISVRYLTGAFKDSALVLNSLANAAQSAVARQMKSEHMKTELITNVSHDIKTPLTSIINFVDLIKKARTEKEFRQYLEVLDRQSHRLKKLIDDLMEMSKASTGNMTVELARLDGVEAINQALGEFADKLEAAHLTPVFKHPEEPVMLLADGRLLWRVLSNLLSNAVKYALPDTRLYLDLMELQGNAVIFIKNISRDQLNVDAGELMERFVRGDASRNTEGSGLGLNIAKSLVELQHGKMNLMVDGDLFKVTLIFPLG